MRQVVRSATAVVLALACINQATAGSIQGSVWENVSSSAASNGQISDMPGSAPDAHFIAPAINYDSNGSTNYTIGSFLQHPAFFNTSGTFNPNDTLLNTYFLFTGSVFLNAGPNTFFVRHDDGTELSIPSAFSDVGMTMAFDDKAPGTDLSNTPGTIYAPSAGNYNFTLSYGECCGAPAAILFEVNGQPVSSTTPEPASLALCGLGIASLAGYSWRRRKASRA